jgi:hypothetical protein
MRLVTLTLLFCAAVIVAGDPEPKDGKASEARELKVKDIKVDSKPGRGPKATKITSAKELADAIADKDSQDKLAKLVDFKKEYLLMFFWQGSGGDRITFKVEDKEVVFAYKRGLTRDLRRHVKFYAIPNKLKHRTMTER